jgi:hypothetical protein
MTLEHVERETNEYNEKHSPLITKVHLIHITLILSITTIIVSLSRERETSFPLSYMFLIYLTDVYIYTFIF